LQLELYQLQSIPSNWGGPRCHRGPKFSSVTTQSPKESFDPKTEISSIKNQWSWGPFERKVLIHYS